MLKYLLPVAFQCIGPNPDIQIGSEDLALVTFNKAIEESNRLIRHYAEYRYGEKTLEKTHKYMENLGL